MTSTNNNPLHDRVTGASIPQVSYLAEVAETIRDDALELARQKISPLQRDSDLKRLLQLPRFFEYFKYELASCVANVLAAKDQSVLAIYKHDPSANPDNETGEERLLDATVHLLVLVTVSSATLEDFATTLDCALTDSLRDLPSPIFARRASILDVVQVTEEEVRFGFGNARLLSSIFAPPLQIW